VDLAMVHATRLLPVGGHSWRLLAETAMLASWLHATPEAAAIVSACSTRGVPAREAWYSARKRPLGADLPDGTAVRMGAPAEIKRLVGRAGGTVPLSLDGVVRWVTGDGGTPLVVSRGPDIVGVVHLAYEPDPVEIRVDLPVGRPS